MFDENNPYAPPVENVAGKYDHSLFWRVMKALGCLAIWFLVMDLIVIFKWFRFDPGQIAGTSFFDLVTAFFVDWRI